MKISEAYLARRLIPIVRHENDTYSLIETEGRRVVTGLLSEREASVYVAVAHSALSNAYVFRQDDVYLMALTDGLLQRLEEAIKGYLDDDAIRYFISASLGITYTTSVPWPQQLTWGQTPDSRRADAAGSTRLALFYELFDSAWVFALLHEASHVSNGDIDKDRTTPEDIYARTVQTVDLINHGGTGTNRFARYAEFDADRNAACWLAQLLLRKYVETPRQRDHFALAHLVLGAFGAMTAVLLIANHQPDTVSSMSLHGHPSFDVRMVGLGEGLEAVLGAPDSALGLVDGYRVLAAITDLRPRMETVTFGQPSKYTIMI